MRGGGGTGLDGQDGGENGEERESATPGEPLGTQGEVGFDDCRIKAEGEQRGEVGQGIETVGNLARFETRPPYLEERACGGKHEEWEADPNSERVEDGEDGVQVSVTGGDGPNDPEDGRCAGQCEKAEMHGPPWVPGQPVRVEIAEEQLGLEENQTGNPDGGGSAEDGKELTGSDGLDEEEQERAEKHCAGEEPSQMSHKKRMLTQPAAHGG